MCAAAIPKEILWTGRETGLLRGSRFLLHEVLILYSSILGGVVPAGGMNVYNGWYLSRCVFGKV